MPICFDLNCTKFLSTPSARRATEHCTGHQRQFHISIHALREEGDLQPVRQCAAQRDFYPRPPRGGRLQPMSKF